MPIYFTNPGLLDIDAALILGVNAKTSDDPIGQFGTGLKYAIAVLLRSGHKICVHTGGTAYNFTSQKKETRGTNYEQVFCNDQPLGFTTALGKNWKIWQAFRELYSNAMDEGGEVSDSGNSISAANSTIITVTGQEISQVYCDRWKYFLTANTPILATYKNVQILHGHNIYFKGILVKEMKSSFAYNFTSGITLTEDRTIDNEWSAGWDIARAVQMLDDTQFLSVIVSRHDSPEHQFSWSTDLSEPNRTWLRQASAKAELPTVFKALADTQAINEGKIAVRPITPSENSMIDLAREQLKFLGIYVNQTISVSDKLPLSVLGLASSGQIYLSSTLFSQGQTRVTGTLLEEHLHCKHGFADATRRFQDYLIDLLATTAGKLALSPLERETLAEAGPYDHHAPVPSLSDLDDEIPF
jgi:hypothetical protein